MQLADGSRKKVVVEVKPMKEYQLVIDLNEGKMNVPTNGLKKLKSFEYDLNMAYRNREKWKTMISWCNKKGYEFIIITELHLKKFGI
jgi:phosphopantetheine adenylyltransferase